MRAKKIILTGAHGTGKTTILNMFKEDGYPVITEVVRQLKNSAGVEINEQGTNSGQNAIFSTYKGLLQRPSYVSDRGLTDVYAYTKYLYQYKGAIRKETFESQFKELCEFHKANQDIIYFYFPIEFSLVDDGVRSIEPEFQQIIDENIQGVLLDAGINYFTVTGDPKERYDLITTILDHYEIIF